jgi:hypothetical protein
MINYFFAITGERLDAVCSTSQTSRSTNEGVRDFDLLVKGYNAVSPMTCKACHSANWREFTAEINIHFPGRKGIDIPAVWVFPEISVCMDCGFAGFTIQNAELRKLESNDWRNRGDDASVQ